MGGAMFWHKLKRKISHVGKEEKAFQGEETASAKALRQKFALCVQRSTNRPVLFVECTGVSRHGTGDMVRYVRPYWTE